MSLPDVLAFVVHAEKNIHPFLIMKVPENSDRHHKYITRNIDFPFNSLQNGSGKCKPMAPALLQKYLCSPPPNLAF